MNIPAAIARIARITPRPARAGTNSASPVRMSQMLNNRKPILFVNFIVIILSYVYGELFYTHTTISHLLPHPSTVGCLSPPLGGYMPDTPWHCPLTVRAVSTTVRVPMPFGSAGERSGVVDKFLRKCRSKREQENALELFWQPDGLLNCRRRLRWQYCPAFLCSQGVF